jgi:hypothetical protein
MQSEPASMPPDFLSATSLIADGVLSFAQHKAISAGSTSEMAMDVDSVSPLRPYTTSSEISGSRSTEDVTVTLLQKLISQIDGPLEPFSALAKLLLDDAVWPLSTKGSTSKENSDKLRIRAEQAWKNMEEWRRDVSQKMKDLQQMSHIADASQRIAARFFDTAESVPGGSLPEFLSAMKFLLYLAVKMEAVAQRNESDIPMQSLVTEITEPAMLMAFETAWKSIEHADRSHSTISWMDFISTAWSTMPADSTTIKAFYLGLANHLSDPIKPTAGPRVALAQSLETKHRYLKADNREELDLFNLYMTASMGVEGIIRVLGGSN